MIPVDENQDKEAASSRQKAEQRLRDESHPQSPTLQSAGRDSLAHELQAYQAELEVKSEELPQTQSSLEDAHTKYADLYDFAPTGYAIINYNSFIVEANLTLAKMLSVPKGKLQQQGLRRFVHEADQDAYYFFHRGLFNEQLPQQTQLRLYRRDGVAFDALLEGVPITNELAATSQARIAISDISQLGQLQQSVEQKTDELIVTEAAVEATSQAHTKVQAEVEQRRRVEAELRLQLAYDELEKRVDQRTAELHQTNAALEALISEHEAAEERLQQRNQELELLHRFSLFINGRLDIAEILQPFATLLQEELQIPGGVVFFYDRRRRQIYPQLSWGLSAEEAEVMMSWPLEENALFQEAVGGKMILHKNLRDVPFFLDHGLIAAHPDRKSFLGVPVIVAEKVYGAFGLFRQAPAMFHGNELTFFKALAQVMRTAVQNARLFEIVNHNREQLRGIARRIFSTQEKERQRVYRELHDEAGQALTGLKIHLQMVLTTLKQMESDLQSVVITELEEQVETAVALCQTTLDHIRTVAHNLRPAALENLGLNTALQAFCRDFARRAQISITYTGKAYLDLPEAVEIGLYRFLQEALTNVARHAQAQTTQVQLQYDTMTISLTVVDDGQGFDMLNVLGNIQQKEGIGLAGMKERIEAVGGQLTINSEIGRGTTLIAWIPL